MGLHLICSANPRSLYPMNAPSIDELPELNAADSIVRISPEVDVPVTGRVKRLMDTRAMRRLASISQLGLVSLVYPGATHSRFEHSLGAYRNAVLYLARLSSQESFRQSVSPHDASVFLVAALMHDIGHWPYCHAIEDLHLADLPRHERLARAMIDETQIASLLRKEWDIEPDEVLALLDPDRTSSSTSGQRILWSMLSGPIDIDKLDYLERDSLHAGVPYGRNFDRHRLVNSLCVDIEQQRLGITDKGKTAAEMMVFARYIMFSEVYWHHAVRSATAMLQRGVYELHRDGFVISSAVDLSDAHMERALLDGMQGKPYAPLVTGLLSGQRVLYKRIAQYDHSSHPGLHRSIARRPYPELVKLSGQLAESLGQMTGIELQPFEILVDAPSMQLEVQFDLRIRGRDQRMRPLGELSPMIRSLATDQFDDLVKRVRVFVAPQHRDRLASLPIDRLLEELIGSEP